MGFRSGGYATVWSVDPQEKVTKVRLSTTRKLPGDGERKYEQDFSGFVIFIGAAREMANSLKEKDRIKIGDCDVTTYYDKEKQREYITYKVFSFEMADAGTAGTASSAGPRKSTASAPQTRKPAFDFDDEGNGEAY